MARYYAFLDGEQKGPFELNELTSAGVRPSTYVWTKGMADWQRADEVPDICRLFRQHLAEKMHPTYQAPSPITIAPPQTPPQPSASSPEEPGQQRTGFPFREDNVPEPDINTPPRLSLTLAIMSLIFCFVPTGIVAVYFTQKSLKTWQESLGDHPSEPVETLRKKSKDYERLAKMWLGFTVTFGIIFWTLLFSVR